MTSLIRPSVRSGRTIKPIISLFIGSFTVPVFKTMPTTHYPQHPPHTRSPSLFFRTSLSLFSHDQPQPLLPNCPPPSRSAIARAHLELHPGPRAPNPSPCHHRWQQSSAATPPQTVVQIFTLSWQQRELHPSFHGSGDSSFGVSFGLIFY